jgi:hypothetical protein
VGRACTVYGRNEECIQNLSQKTKGNRPLGKPKHGRRIIFKWTLREIRLDDVDSIHLAQDRVNWIQLAQDRNL